MEHKWNTTGANMQNIILIPQKMKTGFPNVFKLVQLTLPFKRHKRYRNKTWKFIISLQCKLLNNRTIHELYLNKMFN